MQIIGASPTWIHVSERRSARQSKKLAENCQGFDEFVPPQRVSLVKHGVSLEDHGVSLEDHGISLVKHGVSREEHGVSLAKHGVSLV